MFPFWYGHYPYQVAEYDECPVSDPQDLPRPLIVSVPEERWSRHSIMWRPWISEGTDLFSFFQVDILTRLFSYRNSGNGRKEKESPYLKSRESHVDTDRDKILKKTQKTS